MSYVDKRAEHKRHKAGGKGGSGGHQQQQQQQQCEATSGAICIDGGLLLCHVFQARREKLSTPCRLALLATLEERVILRQQKSLQLAAAAHHLQVSNDGSSACLQRRL
jgi:hypothetical protein